MLLDQRKKNFLPLFPCLSLASFRMRSMSKSIDLARTFLILLVSWIISSVVSLSFIFSSRISEKELRMFGEIEHPLMISHNQFKLLKKKSTRWVAARRTRISCKAISQTFVVSRSAL